MPRAPPTRTTTESESSPSAVPRRHRPRRARRRGSPTAPSSAGTGRARTGPSARRFTTAADVGSCSSSTSQCATSSCAGLGRHLDVADAEFGVLPARASEQARHSVGARASAERVRRRAASGAGRRACASEGRTGRAAAARPPSPRPSSRMHDVGVGPVGRRAVSVAVTPGQAEPAGRGRPASSEFRASPAITDR